MDVPPWFAEQLRETIGWCLPRVRFDDPKFCLRSEELTPSEHESGAWLESAPWITPEMIDAVVERRSTLSPSAPSDVGLEGGRLLLCAHDHTNHNGMSTHVTRHYLDDHDVPPWDTWIGHLKDADASWLKDLAAVMSEGPPSRSILVAWVPREFRRVVQDAIDNECMGMLCWADASNTRGPGHFMWADVIPAWLPTIT